jgi:hypothetical protein
MSPGKVSRKGEYYAAGWGGRIRTSVWWNQNPATSSMISTNFLTKQRILSPD